VVEDDSTAKISTPRSKPRIKRIIHGKKRRLQDVGIRKSPSPSSSPVALPLTPINQERSLPEEAHPKKPQERVFHYSGPKNYFLEDAPVVLTPYQNERTDGGYAIRVVQKGRFVGLVRAGEEKACRELLVLDSRYLCSSQSKGWKGELRYLGGGLGEIVMRAGDS